MLDFTKYNLQPSEPFVSVLNVKLLEIDNTPLTKNDRSKAITEAIESDKEDKKNHDKKQREDREVVIQQFWEDCRKELSYDKFLSTKGIELLELEAGSCSTFEEVFNTLKGFLK